MCLKFWKQGIVMALYLYADKYELQCFFCNWSSIVYVSNSSSNEGHGGSRFVKTNLYFFVYIFYILLPKRKTVGDSLQEAKSEKPF